MRKISFILLVAVFSACLTSCVLDLESEGLTSTPTYSGKLIDPQTYQPLAGATVQVTDGEFVKESTVSSTSGEFNITIDIDDIDDSYYLEIIAGDNYANKQLNFPSYCKIENDFGTINIGSEEYVEEQVIEVTDDLTNIYMMYAYENGTFISSSYNDCSIEFDAKLSGTLSFSYGYNDDYFDLNINGSNVASFSTSSGICNYIVKRGDSVEIYCYDGYYSSSRYFKIYDITIK